MKKTNDSIGRISIPGYYGPSIKTGVCASETVKIARDTKFKLFVYVAAFNDYVPVSRETVSDQSDCLFTIEIDSAHRSILIDQFSLQ